MRLLSALIAVVVVTGAHARAADPGPTLTIDAGAHDRHETALSFPLPAGTHPGAWRLRLADGSSIPVLVDEQGIAHAVMPDMAHGDKRTGHLEPDAAPPPPALTAHTDGDVLRIDASGHELCSYQGGAGYLPEGYDPAFRRGGYLSRVLTPSGTLVTDDYPPNHRHHHGVWCAWTKTSFEGRTPDFWNMGEKTGTVEAVSRDPAWQGGQWAGFHATHRYRDLGITPAVTVLDETWDVTVQAPSGAHPVVVIDLVITQRCATDHALILPTYRYGGIGVRGNRAWDGAGNLQVLTDGGATRTDANETRGRWCYLGGLVAGRTAGIAILCHPANVRSPQPMRVHPSEPFFCFAPSQLGPWSIDPGQPLVLRYRLVVSDGAVDAADLDRRWSDWAEPPTVTLAP